jgi:hypothetical protein
MAPQLRVWRRERRRVIRIRSQQAWPLAGRLGQPNQSSVSPICVVFDVRDSRFRINASSGRDPENPSSESDQQDTECDGAHDLLGTGAPRFGALLSEGGRHDLGRARFWGNRWRASRQGLHPYAHSILLHSEHPLKLLDDRRTRRLFENIDRLWFP